MGDIQLSLSLDEIAERINGCQQQIGHGLRYSAMQVVQSGAYLTAAKNHKDMRHGMWLPWLAENCQEISDRTAQKYMATWNRAKTNLNSFLSFSPTQAYKQLGVIADGSGFTSHSSASAEWYTPETIIERTRQLFGGTIELDPCSNDGESPHVPAEKIFTKADDGLNQEWFGTVYMNPPYGRAIEQWIDKLCDEYEAGRVREAIALVPARTDTVWFRRMADYPRMFIWGRLQFSGQENSAPFPSMLVYLGQHLGRFKMTFADIGDVYVRT